jgi:prepilin-type N-terminal cleavage/methylation domain-containing protein
MSELLKLSIVLPAFNEGPAVGQTVKRIIALGLPDAEVMVVDDGSSDDTSKQAEAAGARVIRHPYNIGNGAAIKSGIRAARGEVIIFLDADGQHNPEEIPSLLAHISTHHMVVGARGKGSETHLHRNLANFIYNNLASLLAGRKVHDLTSGFRIMRRSDALRFCDMLPNKFSYPTTSTLAFFRSGRSVKYVPIQTNYRIGKSKIKLIHDGFEFLIIIMKIAMTFSPFRVFLPIASFLFFLGLGRYIYTYLTAGQFTNMSMLLMNTAVIVFMLGLIAEQIAALRFERPDPLVEPEMNERYRWADNVTIRKGFSLIELLTVVSIIGIIAAIAFPYYTTYRQRGFDARSVESLSTAATAEEAYFTDYESYVDCIGSTACAGKLSGFRASDGVVVSMYEGVGVPPYFTGQSYHPKGSRAASNPYMWNSAQGGRQ